MKVFFKNVFSSCLGSILAFALVTLFGIFLFSYYNNKDKPNQSGLLHLKIEGDIAEYGSPSLNLSQLPHSSGNTSLWDIRNKLKAASQDKKIKGIFIEVRQNNLTQALSSEIISYLEEFKSSGKKIFSYSNYYSQNGYLICSIADSIFLNPNGGVDLKGYGMYAPFFNQIFEKLDVDINIYYAGKYKGSTEPYRLDRFSDENKFQLRTYLQQVHDYLVTNIAENRSVSPTKIQSIIEKPKPYDAEIMKNYGLIDDLLYYDQFENTLESNFGTRSLVNFSEYKIKEKKVKKGNLAIVFAEGSINWGTGSSSIAHEDYTKIFSEIRKDENIKVVLLRLNSPGGSGYASDLLHREIELLREAGKKVYASIGAMATSGAYYMAAACDSIYAAENSLTGSIGVYIMIPTFDRAIKNNLHLTVDSVTTSKNTIAYNALFPLSENEEENLTYKTDQLYSQFLSKVAKGRQMDKDEVHKIAQGRLWTGKDAQRIGLVDKIENFDKTLVHITSIHDLDINSARVYPQNNKSLPEQILSQNIGNLSFLNSDELKLIKSKGFDIQILTEKPSPQMSFPFPFYVRNQ